MHKRGANNRAKAFQALAAARHDKAEERIKNYETSDARSHARSATAQRLRAGRPPSLILFSLGLLSINVAQTF